MIANRRSKFFVAVGVGLTVAALPASVDAAGVLGAAAPLDYDLAAYSPNASAPAPAQPATNVATAAATAAIDDESLTCMAKVVHHESRGQPRRGMAAVARTLVNRLKAGGRFGNSICEVANQRGQFFNITAYHPRQDADWQTAVDVSRDTLNGTAEDAAPGALFFHAAYRGNSGFFRSRPRVAAIGGQVFYR
jgi:spore germination cell wall hydrolase CwlJ-like protein